MAAVLAELTNAEFQRRLQRLKNGVLRTSWHQADYALTRLAQYNCCVVDGGPTPKWVLIGGFAIRHCYGGTRFSRDVDLSFDSEMYVNGPPNDDPILPAGFRVDEAGSQRQPSGPVSHLLLRYVRPWGRGSVWLHINHGRPIKRPPAEIRDFSSPFVDATFKVAIASIHEIIADKIDGLVASMNDDQPRAKDMWDLNHLFDLDVSFDRITVISLLPRRPGGTISKIPVVLKLESYKQAWDQNLRDLVDDLEPFDRARERLLSHLRRHFPPPKKQQRA